MKIGSRFFKL